MKIVLENGVGEIEEKKSRFIAHVFKVNSEEEAIDYINKVKKTYWDARHNCYAYVCGDNNDIQRFSDDGEPQGTAGKPILEILLNSDVRNCLIIVTRYFGGVLLGTGGLIRAYQMASKEGLNNSDVVQMQDGISCDIKVDYNAYGKLQYICGELGIEMMNTDFGENVELNIIIPEENYETFIRKISDAFAGKVVVENECGQKFCKKSNGGIFLVN
ncbi:MAG: YigZ family protein [Eubacteriales bacterium]|nr:YigZ family protein [Eubacteriales bacterium]